MHAAQDALSPATPVRPARMVRKSWESPLPEMVAAEIEQVEADAARPNSREVSSEIGARSRRILDYGRSKGAGGLSRVHHRVKAEASQVASSAPRFPSPRF